VSSGWTAERVTALAPDAESVKSGKGLSTAIKWSNLGGNEQALWGECKGSGSKPYQTRVDLSSVAFKCTCPSRKFPCKHSLGLMFLYASDQELFPCMEPPGWVTDWLTSRADRAEKRTEKATREVEIDPAARAKREAKRADRVADGLQELEQWLLDLVRSGLATAPQKPWSFWDKMGARLVDTQVPGLARKVRELGAIVSTKSDWPRRLLEKLCELQLAIDAWRKRDSLPEPLRADIDAVLGVQMRKEEVIASGEGIEDVWHVWGRTLDEDADGMRVQRAWLVGQNSGRRTLILDFAHRTQTIENALPAGTVFSGKLVYYPGSVPLRALVVSNSTQDAAFSSAHVGQIDEELGRWRKSVSANPWLPELPLLLRDVTIQRRAEGQWELVASNGTSLPLVDTQVRLWQLLAISNAQPAVVFGTWNGEAFTVLSTLDKCDLIDLSPTRSTP
jgi:hypothetical protein